MANVKLLSPELQSVYGDISDEPKSVRFPYDARWQPRRHAVNFLFEVSAANFPCRRKLPRLASEDLLRKEEANLRYTHSLPHCRACLA
jgi:hypothetical protein